MNSDSTNAAVGAIDLNRNGDNVIDSGDSADHSINRGTHARNAGSALTMKQGIFGHRIPHRFKPVSSLWLLLRGMIMWLLWIERLDVLYNRLRWNQVKMQNCIWMGLIDYGRMAWNKVLSKCKTHPTKTKSAKDKFRIQWCSGGVFAEWVEDRPHWKLVGPRGSFTE
jgi:hypothetical protein